MSLNSKLLPQTIRVQLSHRYLHFKELKPSTTKNFKLDHAFGKCPLGESVISILLYSQHITGDAFLWGGLLYFPPRTPETRPGGSYIYSTHGQENTLQP